MTGIEKKHECIRKCLSAVTAAALLFGMAVLFSGCRTPDAPKDTYRVVCTTPVAFEFACRVYGDTCKDTGEKVEILNLNPLRDMHGYEPSSVDIANMAGADMIVCVGGTAEPWLEKAVMAAGKTPGKDLVLVSMMDICEAMEEQVPEGATPEEPEDDGTHVEYDEHIWTSLKNDVRILEAVRDGWISILPTHEDSFRANADAYIDQLNQLQAQYEDMVAGAERTCLVIADRYPFAYLFSDLGLTCYAAFPGCSSETQASFATQVFLVEKVKALELPYIFMVDYGQGSVASTISQQTGAQILTLWSGQSWPEDGHMTYLDMVRENLENLTKALN